ncbi:MAG: hypothetical protein ACP5U1_11170 [Desulfomonilaceae bacterium]
MGSHNGKKASKNFLNVVQSSRTKAWVISSVILCVISVQGIALADPLDYLAPWSIGTEFMYSWIWGTMGYDQQSAGFGSINELRNDLGLPQDNQTYRVYATIRPLEHHMLRVFGSVPELYQSQAILQKDLRLTQLPGTIVQGVTNYTSSNQVVVFPKGSLVKSQLQMAQFGFGYDLDFLTGPGHAAGLQGELRYLDLRLSINDADGQYWPGSINSNNNPPTIASYAIGYQYYNTTLDELVPTLGAHAQAVLPFGFGQLFPELTLGGYSRMSFGLWPNYLNYVDIQAGLQLNSGKKCGSRRFLIAKFGLEHESILHDGQMRTGRALELKRDGLTCSLEAVF